MNAPGSLSFNRLMAERRKDEETNKEKEKMQWDEAEREINRRKQDEGRESC